MKKLFLCFSLVCLTAFAFGQVCSSCNASGWDTSVPQGTSQVYSVPSLSGATYVWVVTGGLSIVGSANNQTVTVQVNGTGTLYVTRYKTGHSACANKATIISENEPDCEMLINHEPCYTTHVTGCAVPNAASYKWYVNGTYMAMGNINGNGTHWQELNFILNGPPPNYHNLNNTNITVCAKAYSANGFYLGQECKTYFAFCFSNSKFKGDDGGTDFSKELSVFPNPVSQTGQISFTNIPLETIKSIRLLNLDGKVIQSFSGLTENSIYINQNNRAPGVYLLQFETQDGVLNKKILMD